MQFHKQLHRHNPPESFGDCFRTSLGCFFNRLPQEMPHFYDGVDYGDDATKANEAIRLWINRQGYIPVVFVYECKLELVLYSMKMNNPGVYYMISGESVTGNNHCCIGLGDEIVWDPAEENCGLIGPNRDGQIIVEMFVPQAFGSAWSPPPEGKPVPRQSKTSAETTLEQTPKT